MVTVQLTLALFSSQLRMFECSGTVHLVLSTSLENQNTRSPFFGAPTPQYTRAFIQYFFALRRRSSAGYIISAFNCSGTVHLTGPWHLNRVLFFHYLDQSLPLLDVFFFFEEIAGLSGVLFWFGGPLQERTDREKGEVLQREGEGRSKGP